MSDFSLYLQLGLQHITDLNAYDHIVFLLALSAKYKPQEWKKLLWLITAFTIGHSVTLVLATFNLVQIRSEIIEFLIPVTILLTCFYNVFSSDEASGSNRFKTKLPLNYGLALVFGLIHGLGFSNYLRILLGNEESIALPLFSFNVGIELGQIGIVSIFFMILVLFESILNIAHRDWKIFISGMAAGISVLLLSNTIFW
jgi:uncharacterized membrane protein YfcA